MRRWIGLFGVLALAAIVAVTIARWSRYVMMVEPLSKTGPAADYADYEAAQVRTPRPSSTSR